MRRFILALLVVACSPPPASEEPRGESVPIPTPQSSATKSCPSLHESLCHSDLAVDQYIQAGKKRARELALQAGPKHRGDYPGMVEEVEDNLRTEIKESRQTLAAIFNETRRYLLRAIREEALSPAVQQWAVERVNRVRFVSTADILRAYGAHTARADRVYRYCGGDTLDTLTAVFLVDYGIESGAVLVCPALYLTVSAYRNAQGQNAVEKALFWIFAHEMGHALDPKVSPSGINYSEYFKCLFTEKSMPREQEAEIIADYWANTALLLYLKEAPSQGNTSEQIQQAHFLRCVSLAPVGDTTHPPPEYRLDTLVRSSPLYGKLFDCKPKEQCCSIAGPC